MITIPFTAQPRLRTGASLLAALVIAALPGCANDPVEHGDGVSAGNSNGDVVETGEGYEATIRRTTDGVAHITGDDLADVAYGQGFASGQDRTCDLMDQIVKIRGERARYLGAGDEDANVDSDTAWRALGIFERAMDDWNDFPEEGVELLTAFSSGWNDHLEQTGADKIAGWCSGAEWIRPIEPNELYAYARSVALLASGAAVNRLIPSAQPPDGATPTGTGAALRPASDDAALASNGWAVGADRSESGGGLLVGNPHFPWEGELRFWESHLTVPGKVDIYGVQLSGLPGVGIGFTKDVGWTHTVSAGNRFTAYRLSLVPGSPTKYRYGDEVRDIVPTEHTISVLGPDGSVSEVKRTTWASHYGPILDFPGIGWTNASVITYRDANIDNDEFLQQYLEQMSITSLDDLQALNEKYNGVPLFNTIAASSDGRAWYADTSATPNLSAEALAAYEASLKDDPLVALAAESSAILLDGSNPIFEWVEEDGARDPGLVPYDRQPQAERGDYVFNANDSFWLPNAQHVLTGEFSPLHGRQETTRSVRTRENAVVLDDTSASGPSGDDGKFTLDEIADAALLNEGFVARELRVPVVERCRVPGTSVRVPEIAGADEGPAIPAATVDVTEACDVLAAWDGRYDLDSKGAPLWREFVSSFQAAAGKGAASLWAEPFDPARPVETPRGLVAAPSGEPDPVLVALGSAVRVLESLGYGPDVELGTMQFALRDGQRVPIHGGLGIDGVTNIVSPGRSATIRDPALLDSKEEKLFASSELRRLNGEAGYPVTYGTSFLFVVEFGEGAPRAKAFLTYGNVEDRSNELYTAATDRFSHKEWRDVAFTEEAIKDSLLGEPLTVRG